MTKRNLLPQVPTLEQFNHAKSKSKCNQAHLATLQDSIVKDGYILLRYNPFEGNWRTGKTILLDKVEINNE